MPQLISPFQFSLKGRRSLARFVRSLLITPFLVASAVRCSGDDLPAAPLYLDPVTATVPAGEVLATVHWNAVTRNLIGTNKPNQNAAWRILTYVTFAQHIAVENISRGQGVSRAMMRGAVAGATAPVLRYVFPGDSNNIEALVRAEESSLPEGQRAAFRTAEAKGRTLGATVVMRAQNDRFNVVWTGTVPVGPGLWKSLANPPAPPLLPLGGNVLPFFMTAGHQFRPSAPPAFDSPAFREAVAEVRRISDTRTALQDSIAKFWALPTGGLVVGYWNEMAVQLINSNRVGERAAAHTLALMNTAAMDALTACHDAKYTYWLVRPSGADTAIRPSFGVPSHPSFPSNHSCLSGTSANVLSNLFPQSREMLQAKANEASVSRVYGGIHYRFDGDAGLEIARKVSVLALEKDRRGHLLSLIEQ